MTDINTAPKDGTRILIKTHTFAFRSYAVGYVKSGTQWLECWWCVDRWREWCGNERTTSTRHIDPIQWAPLPGDA